MQRVARAAVLVGEEELGRIGPGLCVLVGVARTDDSASAVRLAGKVWNLRIFPGGPGSTARQTMDRPLAESGGEALVVSQFTLYGDTSRGRRPSWSAAAGPEQAEPLVEELCGALEGLGARVARGRFGAHMRLDLVNDGPVTLMLEA